MRQFREAGHEVALMARRGSQMADTARSEGFQVYEQDGPAGQIKFLLGSGRKFDITHAQTANTITWAALTRLAHHRPVVFSRRTDFRFNNDITHGFKLRRIDMFVAISESATAETQRP